MRLVTALLSFVFVGALCTATLAGESGYYDAMGFLPSNPDTEPVTWAGAHSYSWPTTDGLFEGQLRPNRNNPLERGMTSLDIEAYIAKRYSDGKVTAESDLEIYNLFCAALELASLRRGDDTTRREWLEVAVQAAGSYLGTQSGRINIARDACRALESPTPGKDDNWFCDRLIDIHKHKLGGTPSERAIALYSIGRLLVTKGDEALAKEAFASAHRLFPKDFRVANELKTVQMKLGDYQGALDTLKTIGWRLSPKDEAELPLMATPVVGFAIEAGEFYLRLGDLDNADKALLLGWRYLQGFESTYDRYHLSEADRNKCATFLGLLALERGDREQAIKWFKESLVHSQHMSFDGYDLRLLKELMKDPSLRKLCISYLQLALEVRRTKTKDEVKALLAQLMAEEAGSTTSGAAVRSDGETHGGQAGQDQSASSQPEAALPRPGPNSPGTKQNKRRSSGAAVVVIVVGALAATIARRRRKKESNRE